MRVLALALASVFLLNQFHAQSQGCDPFSLGFELGWSIMEKIDPIEGEDTTELTRDCVEAHRDIRTTIGSSFKRSRNNKGLSIPDAAKLTGMSVSYIIDLERGGRNPSIDMLEGFAAALDVHYSEFLHAPEC